MRRGEIAACQNKMALTVFELGRISRWRRFILSLLKTAVESPTYCLCTHGECVPLRVGLAFKAGYKFVVSVQIL